MVDLAVSKTLIRSKLSIPRLPSDLIPRTALIEELRTWEQRTLILVCAPAGFGKTTTVAAWVRPQTHPQSGQTIRRVAWYTIDASDDNLTTFVAYLVASLQKTLSRVHFNTTSVLGMAEVPTPAEVAALLLADLERLNEAITLVLDDYHHIQDSAIHELIETVVRRAPAHVHLVIATRNYPPFGFARLRAQEMLGEVRAADLCFAQDEAHTLLRSILGQHLSDDLNEAVYTQTAGWVAGLRLTGLALQSAQDKLGMVRHMEEHGHDYLFEYLVQEVLTGLPPRLRKFLRRTSILPDLCPELCYAALADAEDPVVVSQRESGEVLRQLEQSHIFISKMDKRHGYYRYHPQFQALLKHQLHREESPEEIAGIYRRAGDWYARHGFVQESMRAYLSAGEPERAADQMELAVSALFDREEMQLLDSLYKMLPVEIATQRPALLLSQCWLAEMSTDWVTVHRLVQTASELLRQGKSGITTPEIVQGGIDAIMSVTTIIAVGSPEEQLEKARRSLELLPEDRHHERGYALTGIARIYRVMGHRREAVTLLESALQGVHPQACSLQLRLLSALALHHMFTLDMDQGEQAARRLLALAEANHLRISISLAHSMLGIIACQRGDLTAATFYFESSTTLPTSKAHSAYLLVQTYLYILLASSAANEFASTIENWLGTLGAHIRQDGGSEAQLAMDALAGLATLQRGDRSQALQWIQEPVITRNGAIPSLRRTIWVRRLMAEGSPHALALAQSAAENMMEINVRHNEDSFSLEGRILLSLIYHAQGKLDYSLDMLRPAVRLGAERGVMLYFLGNAQAITSLLVRLADEPQVQQAARTVLDAIARHTSRKHKAARPTVPIQSSQNGTAGRTAEPTAVHLSPAVSRRLLAVPGYDQITRRELQILQLLAQNLTNKEIAQALVVAPRTVTNHLSNLYAKLGVNSRTQAVLHARTYGLLPGE